MSKQTKEKASKAGLDLGVPNYGGIPSARGESLEADASGVVDLSEESVPDDLNESGYKPV